MAGSGAVGRNLKEYGAYGADVTDGTERPVPCRTGALRGLVRRDGEAGYRKHESARGSAGIYRNKPGQKSLSVVW